MLWQIAILAYAYPDYLAYFNPLGGRSPRTHSGGLGSGLGRPGPATPGAGAGRAWRCGSSGSVTKAPPTCRVRRCRSYTLLKPNQPVHGWVAITMLTLQENQAGYGWLLQYQPVQRVGKSFALYYIPRSAAASCAGLPPRCRCGAIKLSKFNKL